MSNQESSTFCLKCGKLRNHPTKEDKTVTAGLNVNVDWIDSGDHYDFTGDLFIFVIHCKRCGNTMQAMAGMAIGTHKMPKEEFDSLEEYEDWLDDTIDEEWCEEPIEIEPEKILDQLKNKI